MASRASPFEYEANGEPQYTDLIVKNENGLSATWLAAVYMDEYGYVEKYTKFDSQMTQQQLEAREIWSDHVESRYDLPKALTLTAEESELFSKNMADIASYTSESILKMLTGEMDIDQDYGTFVDTIYSMGLQDCIDCYQAALTRYNAQQRDCIILSLYLAAPGSTPLSGAAVFYFDFSHSMCKDDCIVPRFCAKIKVSCQQEAYHGRFSIPAQGKHSVFTAEHRHLRVFSFCLGNSCACIQPTLSDARHSGSTDRRHRSDSNIPAFLRQGHQVHPGAGSGLPHPSAGEIPGRRRSPGG